MKYILFTSFLFCFSFGNVFSQSIDFKIDKVDSFKCVVNVLIQNGPDAIQIIGKTVLNDFLCGLYGDIGLDLQVLEDNCFSDLSFDCEPKYPSFDEKNIIVFPLDQLGYAYDITRKLNKHPKFRYMQGTYRLKVFFRYINKSGVKEVVSSKWQYLVY